MKAKAVRLSRPLPSVSPFAERFIEPEAEEPESFDRYVAQRQREARAKETICGKRAGRWAIYAVVSLLVALNVHGWWAAAAWCSMLVWGTGAIFSLEECNVQRIAAAMRSDDD